VTALKNEKKGVKKVTKIIWLSIVEVERQPKYPTRRINDTMCVAEEHKKAKEIARNKIHKSKDIS